MDRDNNKNTSLGHNFLPSQLTDRVDLQSLDLQSLVFYYQPLQNEFLFNDPFVLILKVLTIELVSPNMIC